MSVMEKATSNADLATSGAVVGAACLCLAAGSFAAVVWATSPGSSAATFETARTATAARVPARAAVVSAKAASTKVAGRSGAPARVSLGEQQARHLVRGVLKTLHDAARSGNYSVLRDKAAPRFRDKYDHAALSERLSRERMPRDVGVLIGEPSITAARRSQTGETVVLKGRIGSLPNVMPYAMSFVVVDKRWVLADISVGQSLAKNGSAMNGLGRGATVVR